MHTNINEKSHFSHSNLKRKKTQTKYYVAMLAGKWGGPPTTVRGIYTRFWCRHYDRQPRSGCHNLCGHGTSFRHVRDTRHHGGTPNAGKTHRLTTTRPVPATVLCTKYYYLHVYCLCLSVCIRVRVCFVLA